VTKFLQAAKSARTPTDRIKFTRLHRQQVLRDRISTCDRCLLSSTRTQAVPWSGPTSSRLLVIGEAPGQNEDEEGVPFVGRSGRLLDTMLRYVGWERDDVMVMNTVACRPPDNRTPEQVEVLACEGHRTAQLAFSQAEVVILVGRSAYATMTGDTKPPMSEVVGIPFWMEGRVWVPAYHPAYILRSPNKKGAMAAQFMVAGNILNGKIGYPELPREAFDFVSEDAAKKIWGKGGRGWAVVYSNHLKDVVVVTKDEKVRVPGRVLAEGPAYTLEELAKIGASKGKSGKGLTVGELRALHLVKRELGGKVLL